MAPFHRLGLELMNQHILFDVKPDDLVDERLRAAYQKIYTIADADRIGAEQFNNLSYFDAPTTVRVAANRPAKGDEIDIHFVNYSRDEAQDPPKRGVEDERPIPVAQVKCDVVIPAGLRALRAEFITPEEPEPKALPLETAKNRARFHGASVFGVWCRPHIYTAREWGSSRKRGVRAFSSA